MSNFVVVGAVATGYYKRLDAFFKSHFNCHFKPADRDLEEPNAILKESIIHTKNYKTTCNPIFYDVCGIADEDGEEDDYTVFMSLDETHHW